MRLYVSRVQVQYIICILHCMFITQCLVSFCHYILIPCTLFYLSFPSGNRKTIVCVFDCFRLFVCCFLDEIFSLSLNFSSLRMMFLGLICFALSCFHFAKLLGCVLFTTFGNFCFLFLQKIFFPPLSLFSTTLIVCIID